MHQCPVPGRRHIVIQAAWEWQSHLLGRRPDVHPVTIHFRCPRHLSVAEAGAAGSPTVSRKTESPSKSTPVEYQP